MFCLPFLLCFVRGENFHQPRHAHRQVQLWLWLGGKKPATHQTQLECKRQRRERRTKATRNIINFCSRSKYKDSKPYIVEMLNTTFVAIYYRLLIFTVCFFLLFDGGFAGRIFIQLSPIQMIMMAAWESLV